MKYLALLIRTLANWLLDQLNFRGHSKSFYVEDTHHHNSRYKGQNEGQLFWGSLRR
jgi:hypothetical protein